jgi:hypothetical protein
MDTPPTLTLRKMREQARIEGVDAQGWSEDNYAVIDGETRVGRIHSELIHGHLKWLWFLEIEAAPPPTRGMAATLEEAKADFERRYVEVKGGA